MVFYLMEHIYQKWKLIYDTKNSGILTTKNLDILIKTIFQSDIVSISPTNLKRDFGIVDAVKNQILDNDMVINLAKYLFTNLKDETKLNPRTMLIYNKWEKLFQLAENDSGQHQDIIDRREIFSQIFDELIEQDSVFLLYVLHLAL